MQMTYGILRNVTEVAVLAVGVALLTFAASILV